MTKTEFRSIYLSRQKALTSSERSDKSSRISDFFFSSTDLSQIKILHCFIPIEKFNEIDTMLIFHRIWNEYPSIKTVVPRVTATAGEMESVSFGAATELSPSDWGIQEPTGTQTIDVASIDIVLVPTLCFEPRGYRVGYGKGFYDRFLILCRDNTLKIGLSYFEPVEEISDIGSHDVKLDYCITPVEIFALQK